MKALKRLAAVSVLTASAFAQENNGLFVTAGGGYAKIDTDDFSFTTPYGETVRTTDTSDATTPAQLQIGWQFSRQWAVALGYTDIGSSEVSLGFPKYTGLVSILPFPDYSQNVLKIDSRRLSIAPVFTHALTEKLHLSASIGATYTTAQAHFESTYRLYFSGPPSRVVSERSPTEKHSSWNYLASVGFEYLLTSNIGIGVSATYAPIEIKLPQYQVATFGGGRFSSPEIEGRSLEAAVFLVWRL